MHDPIYKASKPYSEDLNDLVKADIEKGGKGSGVKGHKTLAEAGGGHVWKDPKSKLYYKHDEMHEYLNFNPDKTKKGYGSGGDGAG